MDAQVKHQILDLRQPRKKAEHGVQIMEGMADLSSALSIPNFKFPC